MKGLLAKSIVFNDGGCPLSTIETNMYRDQDSFLERYSLLMLVILGGTYLKVRDERREALVRLLVTSSEAYLLPGAAAFIEARRQLPR